MLLRLGQVPTVVASSAAAAEEAMKTRDLAFASRPRLLMADRLYYGTCDMVYVPSGERWRQLRRVCVSRLLSPRRILAFRRIRRHRWPHHPPRTTRTASYHTPQGLIKEETDTLRLHHPPGPLLVSFLSARLIWAASWAFKPTRQTTSLPSPARIPPDVAHP